MEIFVSAGEASSDIHCAQLLSELRKLLGAGGQSLSAFGLGGDKLAEQGVRLWSHNREFSVGGGLFEVLSKLPKRRNLEQQLERRLFAPVTDTAPRIAGAILVDNGEINLRLASLLHFFQVPVVYYIPPKIWVWRMGRIEDIAQHVKLVLSILPFEEPLYREWNIPFRYVGNPLVDEIPDTLTEEQARNALGVGKDVPVLTVMPGSRHTEIKFHSELFARAIRLFVERLPASEPRPMLLIPAAQAVDSSALEQVFKHHLESVNVDVRVVRGQSHECLKVARAALVKSGTSTLEAALLGAPMVLAYQSSRSAEWLYRHVVRYDGFVGLVNLFLARSPEAALGWAEPEKPVVPELILERCTPENIAAELDSIYRDGSVRAQMLAALAETRGRLVGPAGQSPSQAAAKAVLECFNAS